MNKKVLIFSVILIVAISLIFVFRFLNRVEAREFVGKIQKIENNTLLMSGIYIVSNQNQVPKEVKTEVVITSQTKFIKEIWYMPTIEELKKTNGVYNISDLRKEKSNGSIADLTKNETLITIKALENIYQKSRFEASEIQYVQRVYPELKPGEFFQVK